MQVTLFVMKRIRQPFMRLLIVGISLSVVVSLSRSVWRLWKKQDVVHEREVVLEQEKEVNIKLNKELDEAKTPQFVEREAREKLGMVKEGETVVIMPNDQYPISNIQIKSEEDTLPNWKKWWRLFF